MTASLGDRHRFAAVVGDWDGSAVRRVDLWAADHWLTCDDNLVYVNLFRSAVRDTALRIRFDQVTPLPWKGLSPAAAHRRLVGGTGDDDADDEVRRRFRFFDRWGPTTDNVLGFLFRDGDHPVFTVQFWREGHLIQHPEHAGSVIVVEIAAAELVEILVNLLAVLDGDRGLSVTS